MATTVFSLEDYRRLDKSKWSEMIPKWNSRKGYTKKIPRATSHYGYGLMSDKDARHFKKQRKQKNIEYVPELAWETVPTRLPYLLSDDRTRMYVASDFLELCAK